MCCFLCCLFVKCKNIQCKFDTRRVFWLGVEVIVLRTIDFSQSFSCLWTLTFLSSMSVKSLWSMGTFSVASIVSAHRNVDPDCLSHVGAWWEAWSFSPPWITLSCAHPAIESLCIALEKEFAAWLQKGYEFSPGSANTYAWSLGRGSKRRTIANGII